MVVILAKIIFTLGAVTVASILSIGLLYATSDKPNKSNLWLGIYLLLMVTLLVIANNVANVCIAYLIKLLN